MIAATAANAQDADPPAAAPAAGDVAAAGTPQAKAPATCPVAGGSYSELNAIGVVLVSQGQTEAGSDCIQKALAATVPSYRTLSDIAASEGQWARSAMISKLAMQIDGTAQSNYFHAKRLLQIGDDKGAMEILDKLADANQDDADFLRVHGIGHFRVGNKDAAKKNIERAIQLAPDVAQYKEDLKSMSE